jgi:hypothetical protein
MDKLQDYLTVCIDKAFMSRNEIYSYISELYTMLSIQNYTEYLNYNINNLLSSAVVSKKIKDIHNVDRLKEYLIYFAQLSPFLTKVIFENINKLFSGNNSDIIVIIKNYFSDLEYDTILGPDVINRFYYLLIIIDRINIIDRPIHNINNQNVVKGNLLRVFIYFNYYNRVEFNTFLALYKRVYQKPELKNISQYLLYTKFPFRVFGNSDYESIELRKKITLDDMSMKNKDITELNSAIEYWSSVLKSFIDGIKKL